MRQQLWLVWIEEVVVALYKSSMVCNSVYLIGKVIIFFEFDELVVRHIVIVEQVALVNLDSIAVILLWEPLVLSGTLPQRWLTPCRFALNLLCLSEQALHMSIWVQFKIVRVLLVIELQDFSSFLCENFNCIDFISEQVVLSKLKLRIEDTSERSSTCWVKNKLRYHRVRIYIDVSNFHYLLH